MEALTANCVAMDAREDLPKVSIETEQDWRRIQQNLSVALLARLDAELESRGQFGDKDILLPHINQFLETLFEIARPNLRINGRTTDEPSGDEDDVEPFDEALDRHIWSLSDLRLKWDKEIADRRRTRPEDIEKMVMESLSQHQVCNLEVSEKFDVDADVDSATKVDSELQKTILRASSLAPHLLQSIGSQQSRANSIKSASAEIRSLKP